MSIIYSYPEQGQLNADDMFIGTSAVTVGGKQKNITRNFTVQQIADFINQGAGFVDPLASDFQIPVFNQEGKKITGSIMSQNIYPNGSAITIAGSLTVNTDLTASGNILLGSGSNTIVLQSPTTLGGPIKDSSNTLGVSNQILISNSLGNLVWQNYEAGLTYEGTWNASTNTPTLTSGQGVSGHFYIVSVAGNENLDGNNDWHVGDWAVFFDAGGAGTAGWQKIDNTSVLTGSGTANTFAMWTATETLNDSLLSQDAGATKVIVDGLLEIKGDGTSQDGRIKLNCWNNNHGVTIQSPPHSGTLTSYTLVLPTSQGSANQVLTTDGNTPSQLSWTTPTAGTVTGTGTENYVTKWSNGGTGIEDSTIFDNGTNVGIGTASPDNSLHVLYDDSTLYSENTHNAGIQIENQNTTTNTYSQLHFRSGNSDSYIRNITEGSNLSSLSFLTDDGGTTGDVGEVMRLTSSGNVGIGTASPTRQLTVNGTNSSAININSNASNGVSILAFGDSNDDNYAQIILDNSTNKLQIQNGGGGGISNRGLTLDSSQNVGIGTDSPSAKLEVAGDASIVASNPLFKVKGSGHAGIMIDRGSTTYDANLMFATGGSTNWRIWNDGSNDTLQIRDEANSANVMTWKTGGNVGIGTDSPSAKLHVAQPSSGDATILAGRLNSKPTIKSDSTEGGYLILDSHAGGAALNHYSSNNVWLATGGGNVGIGTTSPAVSLDISATDAVQMPVGVTGDRPTTGVSNGMLRYNSTNNGFEGYINGNWGSIGGGSSGGLVFRGTFDASTGAIASGGSLYTCPAGGSGGTVDTAIGDLYIVTTAGSFFCSGTSLNVGDEVICTTAALAGNSQFSYWNAVASGAGGAVTGSGTTNYVPKFTGATVVGNSSIFNDASGNVGIGTTSPGSYYSGANNLVINNDSGSGLTIASNDTSDGSIYFADGTSGASAYAGYMEYNHNSDFFRIGVDASEAMRIDSSGNVGIGTTSPLVRTQISTTLSSGLVQDALLLSQNTSTSVSGQGVKMYLSSSNSISRAAAIEAIAGSSNDHSLGFYTNSAFSNPTERMHIDSDGNVGIGTTSPASKLHIASTNAAITDPLNVGNALRFTDNDPTQNQGQVTGTIEWETKDSNNAGVQSYITTISSNTGGGNLSFGTGLGGSATEKMRITSDGKVGIGNDQPEVSLDLGSKNDAVLLPTGDNTARGNISNPTIGMIRYNTTDFQFEGYSGVGAAATWGALGGGGTPTITKDLFQVTTAQSIFTLTVFPQGVNYVNIFIDGVYQNSGTYALNAGTGTVTLTTAAPVGTSVEIISTT